MQEAGEAAPVVRDLGVLARSRPVVSVFADAIAQLRAVLGDLAPHRATLAHLLVAQGVLPVRGRRLRGGRAGVHMGVSPHHRYWDGNARERSRRPVRSELWG